MTMASLSLSTRESVDAPEQISKRAYYETLESADHGIPFPKWLKDLWNDDDVTECADLGLPKRYTRSRPGSSGKKRILRRRATAHRMLWLDGQDLPMLPTDLRENVGTKKEDSHW